MLSPEMKEEILVLLKLERYLKSLKLVLLQVVWLLDGKIFRNAKIRIIRDGVVVFTGELSSLKRFKDDVKEVAKGYDCGIQIKNYNDIERKRYY